MVRTVISLEAQDKAWLDRRAREEGVPMTRLVQQAVRRMREEAQAAPLVRRLLQQTRGVWKQGDGLAYQTKLRREWERK